MFAFCALDRRGREVGRIGARVPRAEVLAFQGNSAFKSSFKSL
jgi:hypothetical protein